jgi:sugar phosphate isomerase/epimerase
LAPLSLCHLTVLEVGPPELFDLAAEAGYQRVGLRLHPAAVGGLAYPLSARSRELQVAKRRAADAGVSIFDIEFVPLTPELELQSVEPLLEAAAELGAERLDVSGDDADFARLAERFGALCDIAGRFRLGVDLEFMRWRAVARLSQAVHVVQRAGRENGRILLDLLHLVRSGGSAQELSCVTSALLGAVQISDAPAADPGDGGIIEEARAGRLPPGEGGLPLRQLLDALPPGMPLAVEVPMQRSFPQLTALERARRACDATRALLATPWSEKTASRSRT